MITTAAMMMTVYTTSMTPKQRRRRRSQQQLHWQNHRLPVAHVWGCTEASVLCAGGAQLTAQRMVRRPQDLETCPGLLRAAKILEKPGASQGYVDVSPAEVLAYLARELATPGTGFAAKTVGCFGGGGLVAIVAAVLRSGAAVSRGAWHVARISGRRMKLADIEIM